MDRYVNDAEQGIRFYDESSYGKMTISEAQRQRQEDQKVEFILKEHCPVRSFTEIVETLEKSNIEMEQDIKTLESRREKIEQENDSLRKHFRESLLREDRSKKD